MSMQPDEVGSFIPAIRDMIFINIKIFISSTIPSLFHAGPIFYFIYPVCLPLRSPPRHSRNGHNFCFIMKRFTNVTNKSACILCQCGHKINGASGCIKNFAHCDILIRRPRPGGRTKKKKQLGLTYRWLVEQGCGNGVFWV